jgi:hypothetical protein
MTPRRSQHPRAGLAIGAVVFLGWLGALGVAIASDGSSDGDTRAAPDAATQEAPVPRHGRAGPGYLGTETD